MTLFILLKNMVLAYFWTELGALCDLTKLRYYDLWPYFPPLKISQLQQYLDHRIDFRQIIINKILKLCPVSCIILPYVLLAFKKIQHIMLSVNFFCNISSYDILACITKNYIALMYYAKIVHLLWQFHAVKVVFSDVCQAIYS